MRAARRTKLLAGAALLLVPLLSVACAVLAGLETIEPVAQDAGDPKGDLPDASDVGPVPVMPVPPEAAAPDAACREITLAEGGCALTAARPIAPMSTSHVTRVRPTFEWELPKGADHVIIDVCADRACRSLITSFSAQGSSGAPPVDLPKGVVFWRLRRGGDGGLDGISPTWEAFVPRRGGDGVVDTMSGSVLDIDGDGRADLVVGSPTEAPDQRGRAYLYRWSDAGISAGRYAAIDCDASDCSWFGFDVTSAGDVNGDGFGDLLVTAPRSNTADAGIFSGEVFLFYGSPTGLLPALELVPPGRFPGSFGATAVGVGDLDHDGYGDFVVGAPDFDAGVGAIYVYYGSADGARLAHPTVIDGTDPGGKFGENVAGGGDINGDRFADLVVGVPAAQQLYYYFGGQAGIAASARMNLRVSYASYPAPVARAGDVNGDGYSDVVVGVPDRYLSYVFAGSPTGLSAAPGTFANLAFPALPLAYTPLGDINGDGVDDVGFSSSSYNRYVGAYPGDAGLFDGGTFAAPPTYVLDPAADSDSGYGSALSGGDVNGDGIPDIVVGAFCAGRGGGPCDLSAPGRAYFYLMGDGGTYPAKPVTLTPAAAGRFGYSVTMGQ